MGGVDFFSHIQRIDTINRRGPKWFEFYALFAYQMRCECRVMEKSVQNAGSLKTQMIIL